MSEATFTFRVSDELKSRFSEAAKANDRTGAQLLRDFMRDYVRREQEGAAHDHWFRSQVEQALHEADDPHTKRVSDDQVRADWQRQRAELAKRLGGEG